MSGKGFLPTSPRRVQKILQELDIRPSKRLGQNFLLSNDLLEEIVDLADLSGEEAVLEIGAGLGHLTQFLIARAPVVWSVEIDSRLARFVERRFRDFSALRILNVDVLASKHRINPLVTEAMRPLITRTPFKILANLPYCVATPVIMNFVAQNRPAQMVVTVQREVAQRLTAAPGSPDYGYLSVHAQLHARVSVIKTLSPRVFYPSPQVESAVVNIVPIEIRPDIPDKEALLELVQRVFQMRRKTLRNTLRRGFPETSGAVLDNALEKCAIAPERRAETLSLEEFINLANSLIAGKAERRF